MHELLEVKGLQIIREAKESRAGSFGRRSIHKPTLPNLAADELLHELFPEHVRDDMNSCKQRQ